MRVVLREAHGVEAICLSTARTIRQVPETPPFLGRDILVDGSSFLLDSILRVLGAAPMMRQAEDIDFRSLGSLVHLHPFDDVPADMRSREDTVVQVEIRAFRASALCQG